MSVTVTRETGESITFDVMIRESHNVSVRVTEHPIEQGSDVSDHAQAGPMQSIVTCLVSETPINSPAQQGSRSSATVESTGEPSLVGVPNRVKEFFDFLIGVAQAGEFVDVVTPKMGLIEDVVLTRVPLEVSNVNEGRFTFAFRKTRIAQRTTVTIPPLRPTEEAQTGAPDEQDLGTQPTNAANSTTEAENASILFGVSQTFGFI